jgi:hypothetical protein
MDNVGGFDGIYSMYVGRIFLNDPLEHSLGARPLDLRSDARVFRFEGLSQSFRDLNVGGGVEDNFAFLLGRLNEFERY